MFSTITAADLLAKAKDELHSFKGKPTSHKIFNLFITIKSIEDYALNERLWTEEEIFNKFDKLYDWMSFIANKEKHCVVTNKYIKDMDKRHFQKIHGGALNEAPVGANPINHGKAYQVEFDGTTYDMAHLAEVLIAKWEEMFVSKKK